MLRAIFLFVLAMHALIHLLGFVKAWEIAPVQQLSGKAIIPLGETGTRLLGALWLVVFLLLLSTALLFLLKNPSWWMPGAAGLLLSQFLIIVYWPDAKAGTIANLILLPVILVAWAGWSFDRKATKETLELLAGAMPVQIEAVTPEMAATLPPPVAR